MLSRRLTLLVPDLQGLAPKKYIEDSHVQSSRLSDANLSGQECMTAAFMLKLAQVNGWRGGWEETYPILYRIDKKPD